MGIFFKEPWSVRKQKMEEAIAKNNSEHAERIGAINAKYDPLISEQKRLTKEDIQNIKNDFKQIENDFTEYGGKIKADLGFDSKKSSEQLIKLQSLLDSGIITQEEYDAKKKQLLGL
jgi:hypothetical protein